MAGLSVDEISKLESAQINKICKMMHIIWCKNV